MSVSISPNAKDTRIAFSKVSKLNPYKRGDKFIIPYDTYNSSEDIQEEVVQLMDSIQKTDYGNVSWSMQTERQADGSRVVVVFLVMK